MTGLTYRSDNKIELKQTNGNYSSDNGLDKNILLGFFDWLIRGGEFLVV